MARVSTAPRAGCVACDDCRWLPLASPQLASRSLDGNSLVAATLQRAFLRRSILRLLGRDDLAASDAAIVAQVVEMLRDKVLALAFWGAR